MLSPQNSAPLVQQLVTAIFITNSMLQLLPDNAEQYSVFKSVAVHPPDSSSECTDTDDSINTIEESL